MADVSPSPSPSMSLSRKLSNVNGGVSSKHIYDDVFYSAAPAKHKSSSFSLPVEDYGEIFGASSASSIPVLDLPDSGGQAEEFRKARNSGGVDYAGIFAGFGDDSVGVSFDDLIDQSKKKTRKNSTRKPRNGAERTSPSDVPNVSNHAGQDQATMNGPSLQSLDTVNQINVLYNKANQTSKHGSDGTIHIAHLHAVPGFTYLVDDVVPPSKSESAQTSAAGMDVGKGNINPSTGEKHRNLPRENIFRSNFKTRSLSGEVGPSAAGTDDGKGNINRGTGEKHKNLSRENIFHSKFKTRSFSGEVGPSASEMDNGEGNVNPGTGEEHINLSRDNIFRSSFKTRSLSGEVGPVRRNKFLEHAAARMDNGNGRIDLDTGKKQRRPSGENICDTNEKTQPFSVTASISPQSIFSDGDSTKPVNPSLNGLDNDVDRGKNPRTMMNDIITRVDYCAGKNPRSLHKENVTDADVKAQTSSLEHPSTVTHSVVDNGNPHRSNSQKFKGCDNETDRGDNGDSSPPFLDEEFDINSAAAVSAAAMKKAIEEAETQIRLAKEILKRNMSAGSTELSFKDTLKVKPTSKIKLAKMDDRFREKENCKDYAQLGTATQISPKPDNGIRNGKAALGFEDRTKTDGAGPMCNLDAMEINREHEREGAGREWEASKHLSQLFYGVKNRLVSFMSKQTDSEKNMMQKETIHGECLEQSGESALNMKVGDDSETEIQGKSYTPSWLSNRERASFKIGSVPEVNEPVENTLPKSVASKLERHMEELGPASDVDKEVRMNDYSECEIEEDEVGVQQLCDQEIDEKKEMFSSVQDDTQQEEVFEQCLKISGNFTTDSDCMKLGSHNSTLDTSEEDDKRLEKVDSFIAHEGIEVVNGKDEGGWMNEVLEVGDIKRLSVDSCGSAASIESLTNDNEWIQHNKIEEEGQQQVNLKELKDVVRLVEDNFEQKEGNKEADELSKIASTGSVSDISEDDEKINRQNDQNNEETVDMFIFTEEAVENARPMAAADDICELDEVASQSSNEVGGHDGSNLYIENDAFVLDGYTGASEDVSVEDEKAYESTHAEGCAHDESNQSIEKFSGENRSKMDAIMTPSEPKEKRQEPVSGQLVKELMREELLRTSTQAPDAMDLDQFQKETEVMFGQCDHDEHTRGSKVDVSMENQVQKFANESVEETNASDADAAHNQGEEKHDPIEEPELEDAGAVLDQGEEKHESSEKENVRDADEALTQLKQKQNAEAAHRRRRWFGSREEAKAAEMPSLFKGTSIASEIGQNIEEKRKSMRTILASADELVDGSGEDTNSKEADTGGVDHEGGKKRVEAAYKRKRWFENEGEGVTQQPTLFARNQTNLVGNGSENGTELDDNLEDCIGNFSSKPREDGNVNDAHSQEVRQNPGAATRRKRWFENGEKGGPAPRPSIFENSGLASGSSEVPETRENAMEPEKHDEASMDEEKVGAKCEVNQSNGSCKYSDEVNKREREKIAVERAIREARERAFAEAREKAERAAMERVTAEMLQKGAAAVQDTQEKGSGETASQVDKAFVEAKLRIERAAVERATAEARERALQKAMAEKTFSTLQKAMSEKTFSKSKEMGGRYNNERSSSMDTRHHSSNVNTRYSSHADVSLGTERSDGAYGETAQRRKAVLERNRRTMERAAKALEEKNMRDLLAQKEQTERNRYADALDGEVKRWCSGKEGNLRALLSTLHYVLGPDCGWQPISLTDLISATAVRKAYKRATLCVHPDKLQQRAATIQQKYICEKVFDLLKEAWHKFNPDER